MNPIIVLVWAFGLFGFVSRWSWFGAALYIGATAVLTFYLPQLLKMVGS